MPKSHTTVPQTTEPAVEADEQCTQLPGDFLQRLRELERTYLSESDPIRQSGFSGGAGRWRAERSPILQAVTTSGALLDVGCANGYLLECLLQWGAERGLVIEPFGVDIGAGLIEVARRRLPVFHDHFFVANALEWEPARRFQYVYSVFDCVPTNTLGVFVEHLVSKVVAPGGRLILGAYGNRSHGRVAAPIDAMLAGMGRVVAGCVEVGEPPTARFAWIDV